MIICTGRSPPHMRHLADAIVTALKQRRLREAPGFTGAEGYTDTQWVLVDCANLVVHLMEEQYRRALELDEYWERFEPLEVNSAGARSEEEVDVLLDKVVEEHPVSEAYAALYQPEELKDDPLLKQLQEWPGAEGGDAVGVAGGVAGGDAVGVAGGVDAVGGVGDSGEEYQYEYSSAGADTDANEDVVGDDNEFDVDEEEDFVDDNEYVVDGGDFIAADDDDSDVKSGAETERE